MPAMAKRKGRTWHPLTKTVLAFLLTLLLSLLYFGWTVGFRDEVGPGAIDVSGRVESNFTSPLTVVAQRMVVSSGPEPLAQPYGQAIFWDRTGAGYIWWLAFLGSDSTRAVRVYNQTGSLLENFTTSLLTISYPTFQYCSRVGFFDSHYTATMEAEGFFIGIDQATEYGAGLRLDPAYGNVFAGLELDATSVLGSSRLILVCDEMNLTADGRQVTYREPTYLNVDSFGSVRIDFTVGPSEIFRTVGPASLSVERGNARWQIDRIALSSPTGGINQRGRIDFLGFEQLDFELPVRREATPSGFTYSLPLLGREVRIQTYGPTGPELATPVTKRTYNVEDEASRGMYAILGSIILGLGLGLEANWIWGMWKGPREPSRVRPRNQTRLDNWHDKSRSRRPASMKKRLVLIMSLVIVVWLVASLGYGLVMSFLADRPILWYQATLPVRLHVMAEDTTDLTSLRGTYDVALTALRAILGNPDVQVDFSTFTNDGMSKYEFDVAQTYEPAGKRPWNKVDIMTSGRVDIYMVHHDGFSSTFRAFNQGSLNVFVGDQDVNPLEETRVILHELGHGWGLPHNLCSPTMWGEERAVFSGDAPTFSTTTPFKIDGADIFSDAVNQSLLAPVSWGEIVSVSVNNTVFRGSQSEVTRDIYLFKSADGATYRQVVRTHSQDLVGGSGWDSVSFSIMRVDAYVQTWAPSERWFIAASEVGKTVEPTSPVSDC